MSLKLEPPVDLVMVEDLVTKKIYPTISELNSIQNNIPCTEEGCDMVFKTQSNFTMHLQKHHKKQELETTNYVREFHCPDYSCLYHNKLHFSKIKYLKQHYLKVHADKNFICGKCDKGFSTESTLVRHSEICGVTFKCPDCTYSYTSYESLLTHSRRKKHTIISKNQFRTSTTATESEPTNKQTLILPKTQTIHILPVPVVLIKTASRIDKECQTEFEKKQTKSPPKRRQQQTQTCSRKKSRISAETQTTGDCILKRAMQEAKIKMEANELTQKDTQTTYDLKSEVNLNFLNNENIMHSSCQTSLDHLNIFEDSSFGNCNSQTQTDLIFQDEFLNSNVFTSHIETQTNESLDLCSNMYTQTCDEQLLSELEFTHIQTQTNWPDYDMFVSTETQTLLTHNTKSVLDMALNGREISHMETQTDMEFKQLLEEINA